MGGWERGTFELEITKLLGALFRRRDPERLLLVVVEVARVSVVLAFRDEGGLVLERRRFFFKSMLLQ